MITLLLLLWCTFYTQSVGISHISQVNIKRSRKNFVEIKRLKRAFFFCILMRVRSVDRTPGWWSLLSPVGRNEHFKYAIGLPTKTGMRLEKKKNRIVQFVYC